jgi:hypothetical protein
MCISFFNKYFLNKLYHHALEAPDKCAALKAMPFRKWFSIMVTISSFGALALGFCREFDA